MGNNGIIVAIVIMAIAGCAYLYAQQSVSGTSGNFIGPVPEPNLKTCTDECSYGNRICYNNEVHYCGDGNGDGCLEDIFIKTCFASDECVGGECITRQTCGNGRCDGQEYCWNCPSDCGYCAQPGGITQPATICGNGQCERGETCQSCQKDCGYCNYSYPISCGDGLCNGNEDCRSCYQDCGSCNYGNGHECLLDSDCRSGYCVNSICRSSSTYCGDSYCDEGENCTSCEKDCGKCVIFTMEQAYVSSEGKIVSTGYDQFRLLESGQPYSSVSLPISFNETAEGVTYNFFCSGINGTSFSSYSFIERLDNKDMWISLNKSGIFLRSYFGGITASPFILGSGQDTGLRINYTGTGKARIILFIYGFPEATTAISCTFRVSSQYPSFSSQSTIELFYTKT